ncbi:MAG TPA: hypothetical protein VFY90_01450 [Tepidiformaceae bacterium]|nr:hypothetical protein [Tepidiformaceae bacterium]
MMATDPFDPNIDRAVHARAVARDEPADPHPVLTVPTLFGPIDIALGAARACELVGACREEADRR